jgi:CheY-like chemotaxis protein
MTRLPHETGPDVLVVEDDIDLRESIAIVLANEGLSVGTARTGSEALAMLWGGELPSVVVLDMHMPVMDGGETLGAIRSDPTLSHLPVVIVTGADGPPPSPAMKLLRKPFGFPELLRVVWPLVRGTPYVG